MNFWKFKNGLQGMPIFETRELKVILGKSFDQTMLNNIKNWVKKGQLFMVRRGLYGFADEKDKINPFALAKKIYYPSYVSLESALGYYGIIPEAVFTVTSVSTRKTILFGVKGFGDFSYQKVKNSVFGGFEIFQDGNLSFNLALPEKALTDFFYLNRNILDGTKAQFKSYRFSSEFRYSKQRLVSFAKLFGNKKVSILTDNFIEYYVA